MAMGQGHASISPYSYGFSMDNNCHMCVVDVIDSTIQTQSYTHVQSEFSDCAETIYSAEMPIQRDDCGTIFKCHFQVLNKKRLEWLEENSGVFFKIYNIFILLLLLLFIIKY